MKKRTKIYLIILLIAIILIGVIFLLIRIGGGDIVTLLGGLGQAHSPSPSDAAIDVPLSIQLSWSPIKDATFFKDVTYYEVFFGTIALPEFVTTTALTSFDPGILDYGTLYFWRVDSRNEKKFRTGYSWHFRTIPDSPPVLVSPDNRIVNEGQLLAFTLSALDPNGDVITYTMDTKSPGADPQAVPLIGVNLDSKTGLFDWTPDYNQAGAHEITFTAISNLLSDSKVITITVNDVDRPPVLISPGSQTVNENELLTFKLAATDPEGDVMRYLFSGQPAGATLDPATGVFSWTPEYNQSGSYQIIFAAEANSLSDNKVISVTVNDMDRPPLLISSGNQSVNENELLTFKLSGSDPDGDAITYIMEADIKGASFNSKTAEFSWTPDYTQSGDYIVSFTASSNLLKDSKSITIAVKNVDRPPVLTSPDNQNVNENELLAFTLLVSDPDGDTVVFTAEGLPSGANFDSSIGRFSWTPNYEQSGSYAFAFTATTNLLSDSKAIIITVNNVITSTKIITPVKPPVKKEPPPAPKTSYINKRAGIGVGIPYGVLGANLEIEPNDYLGLIAGLGVSPVSSDPGWSLGARFYLSGRESDTRFRLSLFHGIVAFTTKENSAGDTVYLKTITGDAFGIGVNQRIKGSKWSCDFDLMFPSFKVSPGLKKDSTSVQFSLGAGLRF